MAGKPFESDIADRLDPGPASSSRRAPRKLHMFFVGFAAIYALLVFAGFVRTFFMPMAQGTFSRPPLVHVHGILFFGWTVLLLLQVFLAATKRLRLHRSVGSIAGWLIIPMLITGTWVAARDTANDYRAGEGDAALSFFYGELADLAMFGLLAGAAMAVRGKPDFHKRWVVMGSLGLLGAAIGRIDEISAFGLHIFLALIASVALYDLASRGRLHVATAVGAAVLLSMNLTQQAIGDTSLWLTFSHRLLQV